MKVDGRCHCGHVTFSAEIDPDTAAVCHCTDCQALSGSAFRTAVRSLPGTFVLHSGQPTLYIKTTAESGTPREHAFCPRCGTPIYATSVGGEPKTHSLRIGTLEPREGVTPKRQIWTRSRVAWGHLESRAGMRNDTRGASARALLLGADELLTQLVVAELERARSAFDGPYERE